MQEWPKFIFHLSQDFVKLRFAVRNAKLKFRFFQKLNDDLFYFSKELNSIAELIGAPNCIKNAIYIDDVNLVIQYL